MPSKEADRAAEFQKLLVEQGTLTRSLQYDLFATAEERDAAKEVGRKRAARLIELAELMPGWWQRNLVHHDGKTESLDTAEAYVNERIRKWLELNRLALTTQMLSKRLDEATGTSVMSVQIGDPSGHGYFYQFTADDVQGGPYGGIKLNVPESVAEYFRQQGRRQIQSEFRALLNAQRA